MVKTLNVKRFLASTVDQLEYLSRPPQVHGLAEIVFRSLGRRSMRATFPGKLERVLVVQPDLIGDVILLGPFLRELRRSCPNAWITVVVEPSVYNLVELCPHVQEIITYDCAKWRLYWRWKFFCRALWLSVRSLLWRNFDLAIFPHWDTDHYYGTMVAYLSGAQFRLGFSESVTREKREANRDYNLLLSHAMEEPDIAHEVERTLDIVKAMGGSVQSTSLETWLSREDRRFADRFLDKRGETRKRLRIAMCMGGSHPRKFWPVERYSEVVRWLIESHDAEILIVGGSGDRLAAASIRRDFPERIIDATGKTTLRQSIALVEKCQLYIGNDTAPMHMAAASGLPVVAISCHPADADPAVSYSPRRFGPWGVPSLVLQPGRMQDSCRSAGKGYCSNDQAHCILDVTEDQVRQAVSEVLEASLSESSEKACHS